MQQQQMPTKHSKHLPRRKPSRNSPWLGTPSKMPGYSFNLPAGASCPASKLTIKEFGAAAVCSGCYAMNTGNYSWPVVKNALQRRFDFVLQSIKDDDGDSFVETIVSEIRRCVGDGEKVFRIHDSGDMFSPKYVDCWVRICEELSDFLFWVPTREYLRPNMMPSLQRLAALPNVTVRPSAAAVNQPAPVVPGLHAGSAVYQREEDVPAGHKVCPATSTDDHTCDGHGCRSCWTEKSVPKVYMAHGPKAKRSLPVIENAYQVAV